MVTGLFLLFREFFERLQDAVGTGVDADGRKITPGDDSIFIDDEEGSFRGAFRIAVDAVLFGDIAFGFEIREQGEMKPAVLGERLVAPDPVHGNAEQRRAELVEFREELIVEPHLVAADGTPVGGIEGEDDGLSAVFVEGEFLVGGGDEGEGGGGGSRGQGWWAFDNLSSGARQAEVMEFFIDGRYSRQAFYPPPPFPLQYRIRFFENSPPRFPGATHDRTSVKLAGQSWKCIDWGGCARVGAVDDLRLHLRNRQVRGGNQQAGQRRGGHRAGGGAGTQRYRGPQANSEAGEGADRGGCAFSLSAGAGGRTGGGA